MLDLLTRLLGFSLLLRLLLSLLLAGRPALGVLLPAPAAFLIGVFLTGAAPALLAPPFPRPILLAVPPALFAGVLFVLFTLAALSGRHSNSRRPPPGNDVDQLCGLGRADPRSPARRFSQRQSAFLHAACSERLRGDKACGHPAAEFLNTWCKMYMVFETIYLLREAVKRATQDVVYIPVESLRAAIIKLFEEDGIAIYPSNAANDLDKDLREMQKSLLTVEGDKVVINRGEFLRATEFAEEQEELLKDDKYASAIFAKLKQRASQIQLFQ